MISTNKTKTLRAYWPPVPAGRMTGRTQRDRGTMRRGHGKRKTYREYTQTKLRPLSLILDGDHHVGGIRKITGKSCRIFF